MKPTFYATPADFRAWLAANHDREEQLLVELKKKRLIPAAGARARAERGRHP